MGRDGTRPDGGTQACPVQDKPPPPLMGFACVPVFPPIPTDPFSGPGTHPIPVAISEVSQLCEIEQTRVGSHFECVRETRWIPRVIVGPADPDPITGAALRVTSAAGVDEKSPRTLRRDRLAYPAWERLGPSVVIRRRPQRMQGLDVS